MTQDEFVKYVKEKFREHGLWQDGWEFSIVPEYNNYHGYTNHETKVILFSREGWPTIERNMKETVLHEIAHALVGHGEHTLDWWDKLLDIGGRGIWVEYPERMKNIGVTVIY